MHQLKAKTHIRAEEGVSTQNQISLDLYVICYRAVIPDLWTKGLLGKCGAGF